MLKKTMNGGVAVDGQRGVDAHVCVCVYGLEINDVEYHSSLKVLFILSEHVVSCADDYHASVHATVTSMHLYEMCMDFISSLALCVCVCVCCIQWLA